MNNIIISIIYLILSFIVTVLCYKKFGKFGLYIWMSVLIIMCNIQTIKIAEIFGFTISMGNISYGAIFLTTDILSEKYGKEFSIKATKISFISMVLFAIFMYLFIYYTPSEVDFSQEALVTIFNYIPRITVGSLLAYYISQRTDAYIYDKLKWKYNKVWISNNVSTFISQVLDTLIFVNIAFIGTMNLREMSQLIITMIIFKWIIAILDTPFMIFITKIKNNQELE